MFSKGLRLALILMVISWSFIPPTTAHANPKGKSYLGLEFISIFGNWDCLKFNNDDTFVSTYGLIQGTFSKEDLCLFKIFGFCVFSIPFYEVKINSPSNPKYTIFDLSDFVAAQVILGKIETDDDNGFLFAFQSPICAYPARCCPKAPDDSSVPEESPTPIE